MKKFTVACTIVLTAGAPVASAQELAPGKYTGSYDITQAQGAKVSLVLDIKSIDNGTITGTGERYGINRYGHRGTGGCNGAFPLAGTVKGDEVDVRAAEKFGAGGDCQFRLRGKASGTKIVGKVGQNEVELSR